MIISTTLTANHAPIIADALRSVINWVDLCLVIDTGSTDGSLDIAREIAGDKYREVKHAWIDAATARNFALDHAHELGCKWAMTLDTDERLHLSAPAQDLRAELALSNVGCLYVMDSDNRYSKERFFRLPMKERWNGPVHEAFKAYIVGCSTLDGITFSELVKTPEQYEARFRRDIAVLNKYIETHPNESRWQYYLGESHRNLREHELAVQAYDKCSLLRGWNEEAAWACYQAAESLCALGRYQDALDRLSFGMAHHAGIAELAARAGYVCYQMGRDEQAIYWSNIAIIHGLYRGKGAQVPRIGFRDPAGLWEGPYDVLRWAHKRMGHEYEAAEAEDDWVKAKERGGR